MFPWKVNGDYKKLCRPCWELQLIKGRRKMSNKPLDTADCCTTLDEARGVIRRLEAKVNELADGIVARNLIIDAYETELAKQQKGGTK